ncbi:YiiD C-terminal domain-containing protein [Estrella lausannensis]|uniref:Thioesterase putative domain-containing protein n=1 Tax=Estrella lausannensis TaxID=483423 RepID=A0A0H5DN34_9BACT|nr:YiiD C-terminal domain-containing protein [Estrella lausannensis]CRX37482.1 conserved hypothetical protein [Estrella lausannensis]
MNHEELQKYLHDNIPLTRCMKVQVEMASLNRVVLTAPLQENINHKKTAFGGSLHTIATLSCWSLAFLNSVTLRGKADLVISESHILYLRPVTSDIICIAAQDDSKVWKRFEQGYLKFGKSRIRLSAKIFQDGHLAVDYNGDFAAVKVAV